MGHKNRRRKIFLWLGAFLLGLLVALLLLPLWFPMLLKPVLQKQGVRYTSYERLGYSRFALTDVKYSNPKIQFEAKRLETFQPTAWLWNHYLTKQNPPNYLIANDWKLTLLESKKRPRTKPPLSVAGVYEKIERIWNETQNWLPTAQLRNGLVQSGKNEFRISNITLKNNFLNASVFLPKQNQTAGLQLNLSGHQSAEISIQLSPLAVDANFSLTKKKESVQLVGAAFWFSNRVDLTAQFSGANWLPEKATLDSKSFRVPSEQIKLEGYEDLTGTLRAQWDSNQFAINLSAQAQPLEKNETILAPVEAVIHATGSNNFVRIESARIFAPWLDAELSKNVEMDFHGKLLSDSASLKLKIDLAKQNLFSATGNLTGEAFLQRNEKKYPDINFNLSSTAFKGFGVQTEKVNLQGTLDWPWLSLTNLTAQFSAGGTLAGQMRLNTATRIVSMGSLQVKGQLGREFLQKQYSYKDVALTAQFEGPLKNLKHTAHFEVAELRAPNFSPLNFIADWRGQHLSLENVSAKVSTGNSTVQFSGATVIQTNQINLDLNQFTFSTNGAPVFTLQKPAKVFFQKKKDSTNVFSEVVVDPFLWSGVGGEIALETKINWPAYGTLSVVEKNISVPVFQDFFTNALPNLQLSGLDLKGGWSNGPAAFSVASAVRFYAKDGTAFSGGIKATGDASGLSIGQFTAATHAEAVVSGKGFLPFTIEPAQKQILKLNEEQPINFQAASQPNNIFWQEIADLTGVKVRSPQLDLNITGTLNSPQGKIVMQAEELDFRVVKAGRKIPHLEKLNATIDLNRDQIQLKDLTLLVEGHPISASAELPLGNDFSRNWKKVFDWRKATGRIAMTNAQIASFSRLLPDVLSRQGTVNLDLAFSPGPEFNGSLKIENAGTRPLGSSGPLRDLQADLKFVQHRVEFRKVTGLLGGQPIALSGTIDLEHESKDGLPRIDLKIHGTNLPLARKPDLILRGDLDISISNAKSEQPVISGVVNLRDSFYLGDLKPLVPGKVARPKRRPPYFSFEEEPFADWKLDLKITGSRFMRVRSPFFRGQISADFSIGGDLKEPVALGVSRIESGSTIQFPFANLRVDQGLISLLSDSPHRPQLFVTAAARTFGYDIRMEVGGYADQPTLEFSSTPGLTSEQIILMVTAGEVPRKDFGFNQQEKATRLAMFLGKSILSKFGSEEAGAERLTISSGENISDQGKQTYALEYKLTEKLSIVGEYDRFGALNAGLKWKVYSR